MTPPAGQRWTRSKPKQEGYQDVLATTVSAHLAHPHERRTVG